MVPLLLEQRFGRCVNRVGEEDGGREREGGGGEGTRGMGGGERERGRGGGGVWRCWRGELWGGRGGKESFFFSVDFFSVVDFQRLGFGGGGRGLSGRRQKRNGGREKNKEERKEKKLGFARNLRTNVNSVSW